MSFQHLELLFAVSWHYETDGGDLRLVGRLEALGFTGRPGRLELLEKDWQEEDGHWVPAWRQRSIDVPLPAAEVLAERIRALWPADRTPRSHDGVTANTAWHSVVLTIQLDGISGLLTINPVEELTGPDAAAIQAVFRELSSITGLTGSQRDFPPDLVGPK